MADGQKYVKIEITFGAVFWQAFNFGTAIFLNTSIWSQYGLTTQLIQRSYILSALHCESKGPGLSSSIAARDRDHIPVGTRH